MMYKSKSNAIVNLNDFNQPTFSYTHCHTYKNIKKNSHGLYWSKFINYIEMYGELLSQKSNIW